ncbi:TetR family transcriptional regulator [Mesorhizobium sp. NBSH29]|uniref:TetR/AcrR family transcriptional regulator n=1 Tax=Mesorhizobium sp. NBSH29 TaxID=2654249 RepID=UPI0018966548|nr:TetR/AcrR family transcriptional regulator [Mesorhizobium sp. NBSH29]QPC87883.1 TetR family transcriptional regulator [Mesorhizobium sp. NBSH29]
MSRNSAATLIAIQEAAQKLFYEKGVRSVSMDALAESAGITKKTLYYHFRSKDDLIAAYLETRDGPNLKAFQRSFGQADGPLEAKVGAIFTNLATLARKPKWKGCGFLRTAAELVDMPGHPAIKAASQHKKNVERWLEQEFIAAGFLETASQLARQIALLLDGAFSTTLVHRDIAYVEAAGAAAGTLIVAAAARQP